MINQRLKRLLDTDEFDWDDKRHREILLREWVNKGSRAFCDFEDDDEDNPVGSVDRDSPPDPEGDA